MFPEDPLDVRVELRLGSAWTDITGHVYTRDPITISGGRADEGGQSDPATCSLTINNRDGRYSPRNPLSPYYGLLGRNTPLRVRVGDDPVYAVVPGNVGGRFLTPDAPNLGITGDIDVRAEVTLNPWAIDALLCGKYLPSGGQRSWVLSVVPEGRLQFLWTTDGTLDTRTWRASTVPVPIQRGRLAVRATLDVNNGASGHTVTFYTAPSIAGPWTQLGAPVVTAGITSVFDSTAPIEIGDITGFGPEVAGRFHAVQLRNGINGTLVADPAFTAQAEGSTSWTGADGKTWTALGGARIVKPARFHGEVSSWPTRADTSGQDVYVTLEAAAARRRLSQGAAPLASPLRREVAATPTGLVAYWPLEDQGAGQFASALPGHKPLRRVAGAAEAAASDAFAGSAPLPQMRTGAYTAGVPPYTASNTAQIRFLMQVPGEGLASARLLVQAVTTGTAHKWDLWYNPGFDCLALSVYDREGTQIYTVSIGGSVVHGVLRRVSLEITQTGGDLSWRVAWLDQGDIEGTFVSDTIAGHTFGRVSQVNIGDSRGVDDTVLGHISVYSAITSLFDVRNQFNAWTGENAAARIARLCAENDIPATVIGGITDSAPLGAQRVATLLELLEEAADADGGLLHDSRDDIGVVYRTRASLYNQAPALTLGFGARGLAAPMDPVDDDQRTRNDITVTRAGGSSARAAATTGPLSTAPPPAGVGRYETSLTLSLNSDDQLGDQAGWRLHIGTVDEPRYPVVGIKLHKDPALIGAVTGLELGDHLAVTDPPPWLPPDDIHVLTQGYTETLEPRRWRIDYNAAPASPWRVGVVDDPVLGRADTDGSQLAAAASASATTWSVATTSGPLWTTDPADTPFDVRAGGEIVRVTTVGAQLASNPFMDTGITGWTPAGCALAHSTALTRPDGQTGTLRLTPDGVSGAGGAGSLLTGAGSIVPGQSYLAAAWAYAAAGWPDLRVLVNWHNSAGAFLSSSLGAAIAVPAGTWAVLWAAVTAPASASQGSVWVWHASTPPSSMVWHAWSIRLIPMASHATSPQTLTVTRAVNGVTKAHTSGTDVRLAQPTIASL